MRSKALRSLLLLITSIAAMGCHHPSITAVSLAPDTCNHAFPFFLDPCRKLEGIPFYLPKPLLIIAKNFRNVEDAKTGLTDPAPIPNAFDDQGKYADLNARTNFAGLPGGNLPASTNEADVAAVTPAGPRAHIFSSNGAPVTPHPAQLPLELVAPETFFTYQIVFIPDMTQKYGLRVRGGVGEIRAAMNLVNGWMFTGLGPYYMKDSSTAQNTMAAGITAKLAGSGVADVVSSLARLRGLGAGAKEADITAGQLSSVAAEMQKINSSPQPIMMSNYAEIYIYEPSVGPDGTMCWNLIASHQFHREVLGFIEKTLGVAPPLVNPAPTPNPPAAANPAPTTNNTNTTTSGAALAAPPTGTPSTAPSRSGPRAVLPGMQPTPGSTPAPAPGPAPGARSAEDRPSPLPGPAASSPTQLDHMLNHLQSAQPRYTRQARTAVGGATREADVLPAAAAPSSPAGVVNQVFTIPPAVASAGPPPHAKRRGLGLFRHHDKGGQRPRTNVADEEQLVDETAVRRASGFAGGTSGFVPPVVMGTVPQGTGVAVAGAAPATRLTPSPTLPTSLPLR